MSDFMFGSAPSPYYGLSAYLVMERGPAPDKRYDVTAVTNTIGRSPGIEITINDPEISRRHAQIVQREKSFTIEDLGSTNGTFVNGQRSVGAVPLRHGDRIEFGDTVSLQFYVVTAVATAPPPHATPIEDEDTADLPPVKSPASSQTAQAIADQYVGVPEAESGRRSSRLVVGCLLALILLMCACGVLVLVLDSYNQGQYLYCGGLRPLWETLLGPLGFNPICR
jgi:pSer/pThr/pTyr-binding forkhead associated (FHA) protein